MEIGSGVEETDHAYPMYNGYKIVDDPCTKKMKQWGDKRRHVYSFTQSLFLSQLSFVTFP